MDNFNYEVNQQESKAPKEVLFDFTIELLNKYKEKNFLKWRDIEEELKPKTHLSSRTLSRFFFPEKTSDSFVYPSIECQYLVLCSLRPELSFDQLLSIVPKEAREALKTYRLNSKQDVTICPEFDQFILKDPDAGVLFYLADTASGVTSTRIKEILGKKGVDLADNMIQKGYLSIKGSKYYSTNIYPQFHVHTNQKIIERLLSSHFNELQQDTNNFTLGLARFDLSEEDYTKAKMIFKEAWKTISELEKNNFNKNEKKKSNCALFLGLTHLDKNNNNSELTPVTLH